jgi:hypothetical protein
LKTLQIGVCEVLTLVAQSACIAGIRIAERLCSTAKIYLRQAQEKCPIVVLPPPVGKAIFVATGVPMRSLPLVPGIALGYILDDSIRVLDSTPALN